MAAMGITYSAGGVVLNGSGQVLVVNQRGNSWSLPKGHIDPGEDALTAARREIYEESGVSELDLVKELGSYEYTRALKDMNLEGFSYDLLDEMEAVIVGDPDTCIKRSRAYFDTGCDQILCLMQPYGIAPDKVMRSIELFGEHVIPAFR